jgi:hypothetical protein
MVGRRVGDDVIQQGYAHDRATKWTFTEVTANSFTWRGHHLADDGEKWVMTEEYRFDASGSIQIALASTTLRPVRQPEQRMSKQGTCASLSALNSPVGVLSMRHSAHRPEIGRPPCCSQ